VVPPSVFLTEILGFTDTQIELIESVLAGSIDEVAGRKTEDTSDPEESDDQEPAGQKVTPDEGEE
jgi:hypothetical protein